MNRLCIYMTYNRENKIHNYMGQVIRALRQCSNTLYLVCNYETIKEGMEHIRGCVDGICYRENRGYDSGAFRDMLCDQIGWERVCEYDELILANDSFFGFFYPLQESFLRMEEQDCDYWGMTGQTAGEFSDPFYPFDAHVHSYFLVFRKTVLKSACFKKFWQGLTDAQNFRQAVTGYEIGINACLREHGFQGKSFIDFGRIKLQRNENPSYTKLYELVRDCRMPVMKKKSVLIRNPFFADTMKTIAYLQQEGLYDPGLILPFLEHQFYIPGMEQTDEAETESSLAAEAGTLVRRAPCNSLALFYERHPRIYIYGAGVCGRNLAHYFSYKGFRHNGLIVTEQKDAGDGAVTFAEVRISADTGIVVSVINKAAAQSIAAHIGKACRQEQLFFISDCSAIRLPD